MENQKVKLQRPKIKRRTVFGIKLPPIEPCDDKNAENIKSIVEVDPEFFTMVDGRPIRPNNSITEYKKNIREVVVNRTVRGYIDDEILRIDREMKSEKSIYETARTHFDDYQKSFDKFLAFDNNKTIEIMQKSDALSKSLGTIFDEYKQLRYEMSSLRANLQYIDETLMILLSFETFLHKAAPTLWQQSNNIDLHTKREPAFLMNREIFEEFDKNAIKDTMNQLPSPKLYFKKPQQLVQTFEFMEQQNLNFLLATEELHLNKTRFFEALATLKSLFKDDAKYVEKKVEELDNIIKWNESREVELKESFFNILEEKMQFLVSSEMVLQIQNYVEYTYESLISPNEVKLSVFEMFRALENEYNNLSLDLSVFNINDIKAIEKEIDEKAIMEEKRAKTASNLLKDVEKLSRRLKVSYSEPPSKLKNTNCE